MERKVRKQTIDDWEKKKLLEVKQKGFTPNTKRTNNKSGSKKGKLKPSEFQTKERAERVLGQRRAKEKAIGNEASFDAFIVLANKLSQNIKDSHKIVSFIFSELETYENLFSAERKSVAVMGVPYLNLDLGNLRLPAKKILEIRTTYKKMVPASSADYRTIKDDIKVEVESRCAYRNFLRDLKSVIIKIFDHLYEAVDFNSSNPSTSDYLNLFEHYFSSDTYFDFQTELNSLKSIEHLDISHSTIFNIQFQFLQYHIKKFKQLLNSYITTCDDCTEFVINGIYKTLKRSYGVSRNYSNYLREELYHEQIFSDCEKIQNLLKKLLKHYKCSFNHQLNKEEHSYTYFESELLFKFTEFDSQLISDCLTPFQKAISNQSAACFRDDMMEEFDESFVDFYPKWYLKFHNGSKKLSQEDFIKDMINYINEHFVELTPSGTELTVIDRKGKQLRFTIDYYSKYVLPFFQYAVESLNRQLNELESGNNTTKVASVSKKSKVASCESSYLYKPEGMTDETIETNLTKVCEWFVEKGAFDNATDVAIFIGLMTGKLCDQYVIWKWGAKDLRDFIHQLNSNGFPAGASHWETACIIFRNKKRNKFEPRKLETSNSPVHQSRQPLINKAVQILKNNK